MKQSMASHSPTPKSVSFFSGGGGLDLGLECAGFDTRFANDIDLQSCLTLQAARDNPVAGKHPFLRNAHVHHGDIRDVSGDFVLKSAKLKRGDVSLLCGGPPCQAFSIFGKRMGRKDQRGQLVYEYFRLLGELQPESFVFENVFGLLTVENGEVFRQACKHLAEPKKNLKYEISVMRLNAEDYGVPQHRDRVFIIGSLRGIKVQTPTPICGSPGTPDVLPYRTVKDGLRNLGKPNATWPTNHTGRKHSERIIARYDGMSPGERDHFTRINKLDLSKPSYTIIVGSDKGGGKGHIHPVSPREVTPRESARMQTFPDWWTFKGNGRHSIRQIGNAVPPLLAFAVGNAVRTQLFGLKEKPLSHAIKLLGQEHLFPNISK